MSPYSQKIFAIGVLTAGALLTSNMAQSQIIDFADGSQGVIKSRNTFGRGPVQSAALAPLATTGLPYFTKAFASLGGTPLNMKIIGTDPSAGAATTVIPTFIQPLKVVFASGGVTFDGANTAAAILNSPLFQTADYVSGSTDLGATQYLDAMQRGQFWNYPGFSLNYHVLLATPIVLPSITVNVPSASGFATVNSRGVQIGLVDINFMSSAIDAVATSGQFTPNTLPLIVTDNVLEYEGNSSSCCVVGYHSSQSGPQATAQTWVYAAYVRNLTFSNNAFNNTVALSHEVTEWANDPFVGDFTGLNLIPPAVLPGQGGSCIINFETGDPVEALSNGTFTQTIGGVTYNLQDLTTLWWYLHTIPSYAVNGFYSVNGTFTTPSTLCGPG